MCIRDRSLYARLLGAARTPKLDGFLKDLRYFRELAAVLPARELLGRIYLATDVENLVSGLANPAPLGAPARISASSSGVKP